MRFLAAALIGSLSIHLAASPQLTPLDMDVVAWTFDVERHVPGTLDEHAKIIAAWPWDRLKLVIRRVSRPVRDTSLLLRASAVYRDIVLNVPLDARPRYPTTGGAIVAEDGQSSGSTWLDSHLAIGQDLVDAVLKSRLVRAEEREIGRLWYRSLAAHLRNTYDLADLQPHVLGALDNFPRDAGVLFDAGCFAEALAAPMSQEAIRRPTGTSTRELLQARRYSRSGNLELAEQRFRQAVEADPAWTEAQIRLGRVLLLRGDVRAAVEILGPAARRPVEDPEVRYFAQLFLGRALEAARRGEDALAAYERAVAEFPRAQSALLALSSLNRTRGNVGRADQLALDVLALPGAETSRYDPWWNYYRGSTQQMDRFASEFVRRIRLLSAE